MQTITLANPGGLRTSILAGRTSPHAVLNDCCVTLDHGDGVLLRDDVAPFSRSRGLPPRARALKNRALGTQRTGRGASESALAFA